ncbi:hypothetical protein D3C85_1035350 [compost metagenome]
MRQREIVFADELMVFENVLAELLTAGSEQFVRRCMRADHDVKEVRCAAHHAADRVHPGLHHFPAQPQIVSRTRQHERATNTRT